jgi:2-oxoglutarate dehydrogenase E2 component (dihydrolipoamide succinyltransferase)
MAKVELILPKMGESVTEATILKWLKNVGDTILQDEAIVEIATDKVDSEIPATNPGVLAQLLFKEGDVVPVGAVIAYIENEVQNHTTPAAVPVQVATPAAPEPVSPPPFVPANNTHAIAATATNNAPKFYSPLVMNIAQSEAVSMAELEAIQGTGADSRVTKHDILAYIAHKKTTTTTATATGVAVAAPTQAIAPPAVAAPAPVAAATTDANVEIIEMDRMRRLIADAMVKSKHTAPHVTSFVEADVTNMVQWRTKIKDEFKKREGENLTFTPIFIEAIVKALKDFPMVNISIDGNNIIRKKYINIGMAAALPSGNLIVPVIKNADQLSLVGITKQVNDLANRARQGKLKPDEIQGGTYTLSNVGSFGNVMGTPIINQPQAAILAVGAIRKKPVVIETPQGDVIAIRQMMMLSHSYDHRVIDGALGGMFVRRVADYLEQFDLNRTL